MLVHMIGRSGVHRDVCVRACVCVCVCFIYRSQCACRLVLTTGDDGVY